MLIAFGHRKNVGKDTAARFLTEFLRIHKKNSNIQSAGFADKIKDISYQLYSWAGMKPGWYYDTDLNYQEKNQPLPKLKGITPRQIWIDLGNSVGRKIYSHTWIDYLYNQVHLAGKCDILIIKDLRFPNEAERIKELGGLIIKINRSNIIHMPDETDDPLENYNSWDKIIDNSGSIAEFYQKIAILGQEILEKL